MKIQIRQLTTSLFRPKPVWSGTPLESPKRGVIVNPATKEEADALLRLGWKEIEKLSEHFADTAASITGNIDPRPK